MAVIKEREFKRRDARFFAKLGFEMRLYQVATEANIADTIFRYIKQQFMTMLEPKLLRTQLLMSHHKPRSDGVTHVNINIDLILLKFQLTFFFNEYCSL